jgi:hypothetical protein
METRNDSGQRAFSKKGRMIGLIVRLVILFGVVAGVAYAVTRKLKGRQEQARLKSLESDIRALKEDQALGILSDAERDQVLAEAETEMQDLAGKNRSKGVDQPSLKKKGSV